DAFQEADTTGITRACTKHNYLVKNIEDLPNIIHEAFHVARSGRPGPVLIDLPKDIQFASSSYVEKAKAQLHHYQPKTKPDADQITAAIELLAGARKPVFYTGGGIINAGPKASEALTKFVRMTGAPVTS